MYFLQKRAESHTETENGGEKTQTPTQQRESVRLYMFSELPVGSTGSFGLSRPKEHGQVHHNPPTSRRGRESGERSPDGGCSHNWYPHSRNVSHWKETRGRKWKTEGKSSGQHYCQKLNLHGTENIMMSAEGKFPLAKGAGIVRCQMTVLCICEAWNTQEVFWGFF